MLSRTVSHYEVLEKLGEGGMGVVYKARDLKLDRVVALKFLPADLVSSGKQILRFEQEARAISTLNHANIATIYDIDQVNGERFLVLEYLPGGTLKAKIRSLRSRGRLLPIREIIDYALQMAEGLAHAHRHGIVHRDVKSDNAMFTGEGKLKITDFGLAKVGGAGEITKAGSLVGTAAYMSPEQAHGHKVDHRSDIFSFGIVLYEMATGRLPFQAPTELGLLYAIVNTPAPPLSQDRPGLLSGFDLLVNRCLEKNCEHRYPTTNDLIADLRTLERDLELGGSPERTGPPDVLGAPLPHDAVESFAGRRTLSRALGPSIAVLPFADLSPEKDQDYFCDGMADELITALTQVPGLRVVSRGSSFQFRGPAHDIREVGRRLNVSTVLEGSVQKSGSRLRLNAQLVNVSDGYHIWSERYDRELRDVFGIQDEISRSIVGTLRVKLAEGIQSRLVQSGTANLSAYNKYLKGRYYWNKRTAESLHRALEHFQAAIAEDPEYALAYAGLADALVLLAFHGPSPPREFWSKAKAAAVRALDLDDTLGPAHASLGHVLSACEWNWAEAEQEFRRAIELNPGYATAHAWYASNVLGPLGRLDEALAEAQRALDLDPLSLILNTSLGGILHWRREFDAAIEQYRRTLELEPGFFFAHWQLGRSYLQKRRYEKALEAFERAKAVSGGNNPLAIGSIGMTYASMGRREDAQRVLDSLEELAKQRYVAPTSLAMICFALGDHDRAFDYLEKAAEDRTIFIIWMPVEAAFDHVRSHPRYLNLLQKMGLPTRAWDVTRSASP